jgi:DNA-binding response OmpR family regulator
MSAASILCVEDEPSLRRDLVEELQDAGYVVYEAPDGRQALELLQTQQPDLVLCDVTMPDINGLELLKRLRASELPSAQVPFVFLTAHGQKSDLIKGREFGADDYLVKPRSSRSKSC